LHHFLCFQPSDITDLIVSYLTEWCVLVCFMFSVVLCTLSTPFWVWKWWDYKWITPYLNTL
jgi:hypothetical protein